MNLVRAAISVVCLFCSSFAVAQTPEVLFSDDFEAPLSTAQQPIWSWRAAWSPLNTAGMNYGPGDLYERSNDVAAAGAYSLRLNFDGRNGVCNLCGVQTYYQDSSASAVKYFRPKAGTVVSNLPDPLRPVINMNDKFSRWNASQVNGTDVFFVGDAPVRNEMGGKGIFTANDTIYVGRACGIDGTVGTVDRRSDCGGATNYLGNVKPEHWSYGQILARRFYIYIPAETAFPNITYKLAYTHFTRGGQQIAAYPVIMTSRKMAFETDLMGVNGKYYGTSITAERNQWYYVEEIFKRETADGAGDGSYEFYVSKASQVNEIPAVSVTGLNFGALYNISLVGNWQHTNDAIGSIYMDDVVFAKGRVGPRIGSPPSPPVMEVN